MRLFIVFFFIYTFCLHAQTPAFLHYDVADGMPSSVIYTCTQDAQGIMWFGTDKGLVRFDGSRFQTYGPSDGLPDPEVIGVFNDSQDRLWITCFQQSPVYRQNGKIITYKNDERLGLIPKGGWTEVGEGLDKSIWFSSSDAVFKMQSDTVLQYPVRGGSFGVTNHRFFLLGAGEIFEVSENNELISRYHDLAYLHRAFIKYQSSNITADRAIYTFLDRILIFQYSNENFNKVDSIQTAAIFALVDRQGRLWVCSNPFGIRCYEKPFSNPTEYKQYFPNTRINRIFQDRQGILWFCTFGEGIYAFAPDAPLQYGRAEGLPSNNITALARLPDGTILAGDDRSNVYQITGKKYISHNFEKTKQFNRCRTILPINDNHFMVAFDRDIYEWLDGKARSIQKTSGAYKFISWHNHKLWYGSAMSLGYIDTVRMQATPVLMQRITNLLEDNTGTLWVSSINGLLTNRDNFKFDWSSAFPLLSGRLVAMCTAGPKKMLAANTHSGLITITTDENGNIIQVTPILSRSGQTFTNIQVLAADQSKNRFWIATNLGVYGITADGNILAHFDQRSGLIANNINAILPVADTLWIGATTGLTRMVLPDPDSDSINFPTLVCSVRYQYENRQIEYNYLDSLPVDRGLVFPNGASLIAFDLTVPDYRSRQRYRYECILKEKPPIWHYWTWTNLASWFSNGFRFSTDTIWSDDSRLSLGVLTPPARYHLQISAVSPSGKPIANKAELTLDVLPYYYNTLWFGFLILSGIIYILIRYIRARTANQQLKSAVSVMQLQALRAQINPHFIGNSINAIQQFFYPPDPASASEYIALFNRLLRLTLLFSESNFIHFEQEVAYVQDYLDLIRLRFGDRFRFQIVGAEQVDPKTPFPSMLLQPLLENATIHGLAENGPSELRLIFEWKDDLLVCLVQDNGPGLKATLARKRTLPYQNVSKGIELLKKKAQTLNQLFGLKISITIQDLSDTQPSLSGTEAMLVFSPHQIRQPVSLTANNLNGYYNLPRE